MKRSEKAKAGPKFRVSGLDFCQNCLARLNRYFGWLSCPHCGAELKVRESGQRQRKGKG